MENLSDTEKKATSNRGFEDSVFFLSQKWKELEEYFESARKSLGKRFAEVDSKEKLLDLVQESIGERHLELDSKEKRLDSMRLSVDERVRQLDLMRDSLDKRLEEVESKEKRLDLERFSLDDRWRELDAARDNANDFLKELELKEKELVLVEKLNEECIKQLDSKVLAAEGRLGELQLKLKAVGERHGLMELKLEEFEEQSRELQLKVEELDRLVEFVQGFPRKIHTKEEGFEQQVEELRSKEEELEQRFRKLEHKEKYFEEHKREVEEKLERKDEEFEERSKKLVLKEKKLEERSRELDKYIQNRTKDLELREKLLHTGGNPHEGCAKSIREKEKQHANVLNTTVKFEQEEYVIDNGETNFSIPDLEFHVKMDGMGLQLYLNDHSDKHDMMQDEVHAALGMSSDPAKLVLDAMQGFYPPYKEGVKEFEASVVRRSCCLLLGQLLRMSPKIRPCVNEEATKLSFDWKAKTKDESENSLEILGFLWLVAAFRLGSAFDEDELFRIFQLVAQHRDAPELFRALGFSGGRSISDFIQILLEKRQNLAAIRFIHAFELVADFPPVPILEDYCKYWKKFADETCRKGGNLSKGQINLAENCVAALEAVIRCIEDHKLQTKYLPETLGKCIRKLKKKTNSMCSRPVSTSRAERGKSKLLQNESLANMPNASSTSMAEPEQLSRKTATAPAATTKAELEKQRNNKHPQTESLGASSNSSLSSSAEKKQMKNSTAAATGMTSIAQIEKQLSESSVAKFNVSPISMAEQDHPTGKSSAAPPASTTKAELEKQRNNKRAQSQSVGASSCASLAYGKGKKQMENSPAAVTGPTSISEPEKWSKKKRRRNKSSRAMSNASPTSMAEQEHPTGKNVTAPAAFITEPELEKQRNNKRPRPESLGIASSTSSPASRPASISELKKKRKKNHRRTKSLRASCNASSIDTGFSHQQTPLLQEAAFVDKDSPYFGAQSHPFYGSTQSHPADMHISSYLHSNSHPADMHNSPYPSMFSSFNAMDGLRMFDCHVDTFRGPASGIDPIPFTRLTGGPFSFPAAYDAPPPFQRPFYTYDHSAR